VVAERAHQRAVWQGVYSGGDILATGMDAMVGGMAAGPATEPARMTVGYVRLADRTVWGDAETEQAKEIAAGFRK
jgi:hypothetical protein